jgi:hypothetical protein
MVTGCWCCGQECMFCDDGQEPCSHSRHWCALCKIAGCEWCCGCSDCHENRKGGWSQEGAQVNHDGIRARENW